MNQFSVVLTHFLAQVVSGFEGTPLRKHVVVFVRPLGAKVAGLDRGRLDQAVVPRRLVPLEDVAERGVETLGHPVHFQVSQQSVGEFISSSIIMISHI